jgi:hypothetical protein
LQKILGFQKIQTISENRNYFIFFPRKENFIIMGNLNWLLHKMYLMGDFTFCKELIEQQMQHHINQEYLFYIKVSVDERNAIKILCRFNTIFSRLENLN